MYDVNVVANMCISENNVDLFTNIDDDVIIDVNVVICVELIIVVWCVGGCTDIVSV